MAEPAPALAVVGVSKAYGPVRVLRDVSFSVAPGEVHALIGGNGSGKSTLVKIIAGVVHTSDGGTITTATGSRPAGHQTPTAAREAGIHFVHQDAGVFLDLSVAENLCIGAGFGTGRTGTIRWRQVRRRARTILERFDIDADPDAPLARLRPAERMMVAIARTLGHQSSDAEGVLVLDEPTAALSASEVQMLLERLRRFARRGGAVVFVTHRLDEVLEVADTVTVLRDGAHVVTRPVAGLDGRGLADLLVGRALAPTERAPRSPAPAQALLEVRRLSAGSLRDVSFTAHRGEIVGIAGSLGSGRSRLLRAIFGEAPHLAGCVLVNGRELRVDHPRDAIEAGVAYVPEDRPGDAAFLDLTVANNLAASGISGYWRSGVLRHRQERTDAEEAVERFGIVAPSVGASMTALSGGNQQKVIISRWLRRRPEVLLLDEPSQGVDVGARRDIHALVRKAVDAGATAVVVSSDLEELASLSDRVLVLRDGRISSEVTGEHLDPARITELIYEQQEVP